MMFKQCIIFSTLFLHQSIVWAGSIDQVVSGFEISQQTASQGDVDVSKVNAVTGLTQAQKIAGDIQDLATSLNTGVQNNQGVAATSDPGMETSLVNGFNGLTNNLGTFMEDLKDKAGVLNELGQGSNIYTALQGLATAYFGLVTDPDPKNDLTETGGNGISDIAEAQEAFSAS
ncbi:hypothetical protein MMC28_004914 [Mycoblastus sanguinarius]|nr:hypothetical protein [Mycoblastus sanguinarius]